MQVQGLEGLRRASGLAPRQFDVVMRHAVRVSAIQMRQVMLGEVGQFAEGGRSGRFAQSIRYRLSGLTAVVGSLAPTALSIERGRRVGEAVPRGLIERWVRRRGIVRGIFDIASRQRARSIDRRARRFASVVTAEEEEALRIVRLIKQRGTAPKLYAANTIERSKDRVLRNFRESVHKALRGLAQMQRRAA
jgi:hypothetical protein